MSKLMDFVMRQVWPFVLRAIGGGALVVGVLEAVHGTTYVHLTPIMWFLLALAALVAMVCTALYRIETRLESMAAVKKADYSIPLQARVERQIFCPNCGQQMPRNARFCEQCGANMDNYTPRPS